MSHENGQTIGQPPMPEGNDPTEETSGPHESPVSSVRENPGLITKIRRYVAPPIAAGAYAVSRILSPDSAGAETTEAPIENVAQDPGYAEQSGVVSGQSDEPTATATPTPTELSAQQLDRTNSVKLPILIIGEPNFKGVATADIKLTPGTPAETKVPSPTATKVPPITPTREEPTPTEKAKQGELAINDNAKFILDDAALPYWSSAFVLNVDGKVNLKPIGYIAGADGKQAEYVGDMDRKRGKVDKDALKNPGQVVDIPLAKDSDMPGQTYEFVKKGEPLAIGQFDSTPFVGGVVEIPDSRRDQEISIPFNVNSGTNAIDITEPVFGSFAVHCNKTGLYISPRSDGHSLVILRVAQPDNTGKNTYIGDIGNINDRDMQLIVASSRDAFKIIDVKSGLPIQISNQSSSVKRLENQFDLIPTNESQQENNDWIQFRENGEMGGSDIWTIGVMGSVTKPNTYTLNELSMSIRTEKTGKKYDQLLIPEKELGNGINTLSPNERLAIGEALSPFGSPNFQVIAGENGRILDIGKSSYSIISWMGEAGKQYDLSSAMKVLVAWAEKRNMSIQFGVNVVDIPETYATSTDMNRYIDAIVKWNKGMAVPIDNFYNKATGEIQSGLTLADKLYNKKSAVMVANVTRLINQAGAPVILPAPKGDIDAHEKMFKNNRSLKTENQIEGVNIDVGALSEEDAIKMILKYRAMGIDTNMDEMADNINGLSVEQLIDISILTGSSRTIGTPERRDPTKGYAVESQNDNVSIDNTYTDVYTRYHRKLDQVRSDSGKYLVLYGAINDKPHFFAQLREDALLWSKFKEVHSKYDVESMLNAALLHTSIQSQSDDLD